MTIARAKGQFKGRVRRWAKKLGVDAKTITVRPMTTKWASCSTNGNLTFDAALLALDHDLADFVIVHELLHFSVPNHGKLWKSLMTVHLGDYEHLAVRLRALPARDGARQESVQSR